MLIVIIAKLSTGTLLVAGVQRKQLKVPAQGKTAPRDSSSSEDSTIKADAPVPQGKGVSTSDFIVGAQKGGKPYLNSDSGSSNETPAVHTVQLSDLQAQR